MDKPITRIFGTKDGNVVAGGFMSYAPDIDDVTYIDKIFRGAKAADLPVEFPIPVRVYLRTAKALGIDVSPTLLGRADEVIE